MYSNRYIAFHCCQEKYSNEIKENGISKDTKAVFILDLKDIDREEICNTLAVSFYHGIGINGWTSILNNGKRINEIDNYLDISIARISKEQEEIIKNSQTWNYYKIINKDERTLNYFKIKDIGPVKSIIQIEKQELYSENIIKNNDIDLVRDRFFIKNIYNDANIKNNEIVVKKIEEVCYNMAKEKVDDIIKDILKINN